MSKQRNKKPIKRMDVEEGKILFSPYYTSL